jgi:hypothetical protein
VMIQPICSYDKGIVSFAMYFMICLKNDLVQILNLGASDILSFPCRLFFITSLLVFNFQEHLPQHGGDALV